MDATTLSSMTAIHPLAAAQERPIRYAVAWRGRDGIPASGSLSLEGQELVLRGRGLGGSAGPARVPLERIAAVRIGRIQAERVHGQRSVVLELDDGEIVAMTPLGAVGAVLELADMIAELRPEARRPR